MLNLGGYRASAGTQVMLETKISFNQGREVHCCEASITRAAELPVKGAWWLIPILRSHSSPS